MQLQIAILTHNALEYTERRLASLVRETTPAHQIYILDNASMDGTPAWLREHAASTPRRERPACGRVPVRPALVSHASPAQCRLHRR